MNFPHHVTLIMFRSKGKVAWWEGLWLNAVSLQQKKLFSYWNTFLPIHKLWCLYCVTKAKFHILHLEELIIVSCNSKFSSVQSLNRGWLFATPWTAACQASLSITNSRSLLKLMSIKLVMPFNHLILYHPLLFLPSIFPSIRVFSMSQFFSSGGPSTGASASVLPMKIQDWFPSGLTSLISFQFKVLWRVFSNTTVQQRQLLSSISVKSLIKNSHANWESVWLFWIVSKTSGS